MNVILGDCIEVMAGMVAESFDAIVTDPPYDLTAGAKGGTGQVNLSVPQGRARIGGFMGKAWDGTGVAFDPATWREAFRVAKPGAHLLAFGGTRTYHRLASAIEDAGWEIRDCLVWAYASGFPKSLDVSKAIDKAAGAERDPQLMPTKPGNNPEQAGPIALGATGMTDVSGPATEAAARWDGWGTALKPAWEPIVMARKPLRGTVAANVLVHGTGALNIDATRIGMTPQDADFIGKTARPNSRGKEHQGTVMNRPATPTVNVNAAGRWPANLILTDPIFDGDTPGVVGGGTQERWFSSPNGDSQPGGAFSSGTKPKGYNPDTYGDSGTYSRFFLVPKASRGDREPPIKGQLEQREVLIGAEGHKLNPMTGKPVVDVPRENQHPTVKPVELMRHLVRLVTPPGGTILDPFLGSGTTAVAAIMEGFNCVGIEKEPDYVAIAEARLNGVQQGWGW